MDPAQWLMSNKLLSIGAICPTDVHFPHTQAPSTSNDMPPSNNPHHSQSSQAIGVPKHQARLAQSLMSSAPATPSLSSCMSMAKFANSAANINHASTSLNITQHAATPASHVASNCISSSGVGAGGSNNNNINNYGGNNSKNNNTINHIKDSMSNILSEYGGNLDNLLFDASQQIHTTNNQPHAPPHHQQHRLQSNNNINGINTYATPTGAASTIANQTPSPLAKHQHLQKLLKASNSQLKTSSLSTASTSHSPAFNAMTHRNDPPMNIAPAINAVQQQKQRNHSLTQYSSSSSTMSTPSQSTFSVPKSLLNLAACTSGSTASSCKSNCNSPKIPLNAKGPMKQNTNNQLHLKTCSHLLPTRGAHPASISISNTQSMQHSMMVNNNIRIQENQASGNMNRRNQPSSTNNETIHMTRSATAQINNDQTNFRNNSRQAPVSLLSRDDQSRKLNLNRQITGTNNDQNFSQNSTNDAYLADLQERAARAGVSIGMIPDTTRNNQAKIFVSNDPKSRPHNQSSSSDIPSQMSQNRKEIESALTRVEARNDLSLLYPPTMISASSQKKINALSAGLQNNDDSEIYTNEVKRVVLEECNIIYECKECSNLFRSLANLVKHKRFYCTDKTGERSILEIVGRPSPGLVLPMDAPPASDPSVVRKDCDIIELEPNSAIVNSLPEETRQVINYEINPRGPERRYNLVNELRMLRMIQNQDRRAQQQRDAARQRDQNRNMMCKNTTSEQSSYTSLSKLLHHQPHNKLPASQDVALMDADTSKQDSRFQSVKTIDIDKRGSSLLLMNEQSNLKSRSNEKQNSGIQVKAQLSSSLQSILEASDTENNKESKTLKKVAPKRKFLEDCIQKVKRDKLIDDQSKLEMVQTSPIATNSNAVMMKKSSKKIEDVDKLSDQLLDTIQETTENLPGIQTRRKNSQQNTVEQQANISSIPDPPSALLKALTRPMANDLVYVSTPSEFPPRRTNEIETKINDEDINRNIHIETKPLSPIFENYTCDICQTNFDHLQTLLEHTFENHTEEKMVFPCIFCSFSFLALENVSRHIIDVHKKPKNQINRLKEVVRSRSHMSSDFQACQEYLTTNIAKPIDKKPETILDTHQATSKFEGMTTRAKRKNDVSISARGDEIDDNRPKSSKIRSHRSRSADQACAKTKDLKPSPKRLSSLNISPSEQTEQSHMDEPEPTSLQKTAVACTIEEYDLTHPFDNKESAEYSYSCDSKPASEEAGYVSRIDDKDKGWVDDVESRVEEDDEPMKTNDNIFERSISSLDDLKSNDSESLMQDDNENFNSQTSNDVIEELDNSDGPDTIPFLGREDVLGQPIASIDEHDLGGHNFKLTLENSNVTWIEADLLFELEPKRIIQKYLIHLYEYERSLYDILESRYPDAMLEMYQDYVKSKQIEKLQAQNDSSDDEEGNDEEEDDIDEDNEGNVDEEDYEDESDEESTSDNDGGNYRKDDDYPPSIEDTEQVESIRQPVDDELTIRSSGKKRLLKSSPIIENPTAPSTSTASGGIKKLKIQLKAKSDEKCKVYEIV